VSIGIVRLSGGGALWERFAVSVVGVVGAAGGDVPLEAVQAVPALYWSG